MAFVVVRRDGRFEIRESVTTPNGPRARTLATFRELTDSVLERAESNACRPFDRTQVERRAISAGASRDTRDVARRAHALLADLHSGHRLPPILAGALALELAAAGGALPDTLPPLSDWLGASTRQRGEALRDLLRMTDRIPQRQQPRRRPFPRLASAPT
jgi:hypothetical protein